MTGCLVNEFEESFVALIHPDRSVNANSHLFLTRYGNVGETQVAQAKRADCSLRQNRIETPVSIKG